MLHVRLVQGLRSADALDFSRCCRLRHVQHVVDRDDANEHAGGVGHRQRTTVVLTEYGDRCFLIVGGLQGHKASIHEVGDAAVQRGQQELANANVINQ